MSRKVSTYHLKKVTALVLALVLLLTGGAIGLITARQSVSSILQEHDNHMLDLVKTVDHNAAFVLSRCKNSLEKLILSEAASGEAEALSSGNVQKLATDVSSSSFFDSLPVIDSLLVSRNGAFIASVNGGLPELYRLESQEGGAYGKIYNTYTHTYYYYVSAPGNHPGVVYYVLINSETFLRQIVVDTVYNDYWIVLFDQSNGVVIQNNARQPICFLLDAEEAAARNDGFSFMVDCERNKKSDYCTYSYENGEAGMYRVRMLAFPSSGSQNGVFSVAVGVNYNTVLALIREYVVDVTIECFLIAVSLATFMFFVFHSGKKEREMAEELKALETKNKISADLLSQQQSLAHHQKLETIGLITAGVAHEFNNLLSPITANSLLLLEKTSPDNTDVYDGLVEVYQASSRAKKLVSRISRLSRKSPSDQMTPLDPSEALSSALSVASTVIPENVNVKKEIYTDKKFLGDEPQIIHMFLNLIINAVQAMDEKGGCLTLSAADNGEEILMSVSDTGPGIPEDKLTKIFEPFYTTKEVGKGTGLGLSICLQTATNHGGTLIAENLPQGGARFTFAVPIFKPDGEDENEK